MHTHSLAAYMRRIDRDDWNGAGDLMLSSVDALARAGAQFAICPDNTLHRAFDYVAARSRLPWLHIADVVADEAARRGFGRLALTGTRYLVESEVYPQRLSARGIESVRPDPRELVRGGEHQLAHAPPVAAVDALHVRGERGRVHRDFGVVVRAEERGALHADGPVAEGGALCGAGDDADVLCHNSILQP